MNKTKGVLYLLSAAFLFSLSTVFLKLAINPPYFTPPAVGTFTRFIIGLAVFSSAAFFSGGSLKPNNMKTVGMRAALNTFAVILLFESVRFTTVSKANILNLTYPAFVFLLAPFIAGEKQRRRHYLYLIATLTGAALIVGNGMSAAAFSRLNRGDMLALASGIVSGFAITGLREARKYDTTAVILLYQMAVGSIASFALMMHTPVLPKGMALAYIVTAGILSNAGQFCITEGYRYISAALGSVVLESGILFSGILGISIFHDPLTATIVLGGLLILGSIAGISGIFNRGRRETA